MRWKEIDARDDHQYGDHQHQEALSQGELEIRWIISGLRARFLVLQGILELQEQTAVANHFLAILQAAGDLRLAAVGIADGHWPPCKLICAAALHVNERLIFRIA